VSEKKAPVAPPALAGEKTIFSARDRQATCGRQITWSAEEEGRERGRDDLLKKKVGGYSRGFSHEVTPDILRSEEKRRGSVGFKCVDETARWDRQVAKGPKVH